MPYLELYAVLAAASTWGPLWSGKRWRLFTDAETVVKLYRNGYARDAGMASLIRSLFAVCVRFSFRLTLEHVRGAVNVGADLLSRGQVYQFLQQFPHMRRSPTPVPSISLL